MGETRIDPKALEEAMLKALPTLFQTPLGTTSNPAVEFYNKFHRAADDHDRDFIKKYDEDLNSTLIFAGLFSAVASAFIIDVQSNLEPDFEEMNNTLLKIVASAALGNIPTGADATLPEWNGPDSTIVHAQVILYSSLLTSLLAAFVAILGKQWLNRYASVERGSVVDRGRDRKRKMDGMVTWRFGLVMECLPLMLQAALLLLGYALSKYLLFINRVVSDVVGGFTALGLLFYFLIVFAGTLSYDCPFQTPLSLLLRLLIRFDNEHKRYLKRSKRWSRRVFSHMKTIRQKPTPCGPCGLGRFHTSHGNIFGEHIELHVVSNPPPTFNLETDWDGWDGYVVDSNCIAWMLGMPMDADITASIAGLIPEIVWHADYRTIPLERLYDTVLKCFDHLSGRPVLKPTLKDHAYLSAKALVHMGILHKSIGNGSGNPEFKSIMDRHRAMGFGHYKGDSDLESALGFIDRVFGTFGPINWQNFSLTIPHRAWVAHILLYRAWDLLGKGKPVPHYIKEFVRLSLQLGPAAPAPMRADCLFIIVLVLGIGLHPQDLPVIDKSAGVGPQIHRIYIKLFETFGNPSSTTAEINRALEVLWLMDPLIDSVDAQNSYDLFHIVMQAPVSLAYPGEKKWIAARLAMRGAHKWVNDLPQIGDPRDIFAFLNHHLDLITGGYQDQEGPIQNALHVLGRAPGLDIIEPKCIDLTNTSFIRGICHVFREEQPLQLRAVAFSFLPLLDEEWFNTPRPIMESDQMKSFCADWASTVGAIEHTDDVRRVALTTYLGMIDSLHWRPFILAEKWKLLEYFTSVPDDSRPLGRCINNRQLMKVIVDLGNPDIVALWFAILGYKYTELVPGVQEQLGAVVVEVAQGGGADLDICLSVIDSELERAICGLDQETLHCNAVSGSLGTESAKQHEFREEVEQLQRAKATLVALKRG